MRKTQPYAVGMILFNRRVEMDDDEGRERYTPVASIWRIVRIDGDLHDLVCEATGAAIRPTRAELETDFVVVSAKAIPPDFSLPETVRPDADGMRIELRVGAYDIAERLGDLGLPADQASTVVVDWLVEQACVMAMAVAVGQGRQPEKMRWLAVTGDKFDRVFSSYGAIIDMRPVL